MYVSFKPPQAVAYLHEAERKESAPNNRPINLETCCHMRRWVEIKEMEVNRSWTENLGIMWRSVFCCMEVERLTPQTEVEIKINSDLDSTLIPCSACLFSPSMRPVETQNKLSLHRLWKTTFLWVHNARIVFSEKVIPHCAHLSFLPIWIQTVLSPVRGRQLEGIQWANFKLSIHNCSGLRFYSYRA